MSENRIHARIENEVVASSLKPKLVTMVDNYAKLNDESRSAVVREALDKFFNSMPPQEKAKYLPSNKHSY
jgi:hypothetical protein